MYDLGIIHDVKKYNLSFRRNENEFALIFTFDCVCLRKKLKRNNISHLSLNLVCFATKSHQAFFTIKIGHAAVPKLHFSGHQRGQCMLGVCEKPAENVTMRNH